MTDCVHPFSPSLEKLHADRRTGTKALRRLGEPHRNATSRQVATAVSVILLPRFSQVDEWVVTTEKGCRAASPSRNAGSRASGVTPMVAGSPPQKGPCPLRALARFSIAVTGVVAKGREILRTSASHFVGSADAHTLTLAAIAQRAESSAVEIGRAHV